MWQGMEQFRDEFSPDPEIKYWGGQGNPERKMREPAKNDPADAIMQMRELYVEKILPERAAYFGINEK